MSSGNDDFDDAAFSGAVDEFDLHTGALLQLVQDYIEEHDLLEEMMSLVLLNLAVRLRMVGYALETEKPSVSGLKLDLDRFRSELDGCIRAAKKEADRFIADAKAAREKAESEAEEEADDMGDVPS